jgi:hypothetical protein
LGYQCCQLQQQRRPAWGLLKGAGKQQQVLVLQQEEQEEQLQHGMLMLLPPSTTAHLQLSSFGSYPALTSECCPTCSATQLSTCWSNMVTHVLT